MPLDPKKVDAFNRGLQKSKKMTPTPAPQPTSGQTEEVPEHDEFSSDKDSEHKKYMKSDSKPSY